MINSIVIDWPGLRFGVDTLNPLKIKLCGMVPLLVSVIRINSAGGTVITLGTYLYSFAEMLNVLIDALADGLAPGLVVGEIEGLVVALGEALGVGESNSEGVGVGETVDVGEGEI